jgi:hypothetical protein
VVTDGTALDRVEDVALARRVVPDVLTDMSARKDGRLTVRRLRVLVGPLFVDDPAPAAGGEHDRARPNVSAHNFAARDLPGCSPVAS